MEPLHHFDVSRQTLSTFNCGKINVIINAWKNLLSNSDKVTQWTDDFADVDYVDQAFVSIDEK